MAKSGCGGGGNTDAKPCSGTTWGITLGKTGVNFGRFLFEIPLLILFFDLLNLAPNTKLLFCGVLVVINVPLPLVLLIGKGSNLGTGRIPAVVLGTPSDDCPII